MRPLRHRLELRSKCFCLIDRFCSKKNIFQRQTVHLVLIKSYLSSNLTLHYQILTSPMPPEYQLLSLAHYRVCECGVMYHLGSISFTFQWQYLLLHCKRLRNPYFSQHFTAQQMIYGGTGAGILDQHVHCSRKTVQVSSQPITFSLVFTFFWARQKLENGTLDCAENNHNGILFALCIQHCPLQYSGKILARLDDKLSPDRANTHHWGRVAA